jgi:hypothetical protein
MGEGCSNEASDDLESYRAVFFYVGPPKSQFVSQVNNSSRFASHRAIVVSALSTINVHNVFMAM